MIYFLLGIVAGWLIPRPRFIAPFESRIWDKVKKKVPAKYRWW